MTKPITMALLQNKIGSQPYNEVKKLNLWGIDCEDLSPLTLFPNLQILQLSKNQIETLRHLSKLKELKELYLGQNNIKDISELEHLKELSNLRVLSLIENPVVEHPEYKRVALKYCLALQVLDDLKIMEQDRILLQEEELFVNSDQGEQYENQKQNKHLNKKEKSTKQLKSKHKLFQSSDQSTNGSKNKFDTNSQKLSNTCNDIKTYPTSETSQQFKNKIQKQSSNNKSKYEKKKISSPQYITLDSSYSMSESINRSTLKKLKKLTDKTEQNGQIYQSKQQMRIDKQEKQKNLGDFQWQTKKKQSEELDQINNEQLNQYLVQVISNLIQFIDQPALQCLHKILCQKVK